MNEKQFENNVDRNNCIRNEMVRLLKESPGSGAIRASNSMFLFDISVSLAEIADSLKVMERKL